VARARAVSLPQAALLVAPATVVANALGYAFTLVLSRLLGPSEYGELGSALGLVLIGTVPALAMQPVVARHVAVHLSDRDAGSTDSVVTAALRRAAVVGLLTTALFVLASPLVTSYLRLDSPAPALWLALSLAPAPVLLAAQGALQGREQFARMSCVFVLAALGRLVGAAVCVHWSPGVTGALAGSAAGAFVVAALAVGLLGLRAPGGSRGPAVPYGEIAAAASAMCGLLVLGNIDVLLARHYLSPDDAGLYAVGTVFTKAALWGPQAVSLLVFARLAQPDGDPRLLRRAVGLVTALGALLVLGTAVLGGPAVRLLFGEAYAGVARDAWLFTATGAALAVAQLLLFARLAVRDRVLPVAVLLVALAQVVVVVAFTHASVEQVVRTSLAGALTLVAAGYLLERRSRPGAPPSDVPLGPADPLSVAAP